MLPRSSFLSVSLLFFILAVSMVFIVVSYPNILRPVLRRDRVLQDAFVVPWARPGPSIDVLSRILPSDLPWDLVTTMTGALRLDVTYRIDIPNETRTVPSTVYLAHDETYLYVGGVFRGMYANPTSQANGTKYSNYFRILFDVDNDHKLSRPESGSGLASYICQVGWRCYGGRWNSLLGYADFDMAWVDLDGYIGRESQKREGYWDLAKNICNQPFAVGNYVVEYDSSNGTLTVLFSRHLSLSGSCANALQMRPGERWTMGFLLELGYSNGYDVYKDFVDGWPMKAYPYLTNDASQWPKLVIDLANPPSGFSG